MWYTIPESKSEQKEVVDAFMKGGLQFDLSLDDELRKEMEDLLEAYFDEKKFDEKTYDSFCRIYNEISEEFVDVDDNTKEEMFPGDRSYASFKKEFEKAWKIMSYNALGMDTDKKKGELNAEQDAKVKQIDQKIEEKKQKEAEERLRKEQEEAAKKAEEEKLKAARKAEREQRRAARKAEREKLEAARKAEEEKLEAVRKAEREQRRAARKIEKEKREAARKVEQEKKELENLQKQSDEAFSASQSLLKNEDALKMDSEAVMKSLEEHKERYGNVVLAMGEDRGKELRAFKEAVEKSQKKIEKEMDKKLDDIQTEYDQTLKTNLTVVAKLDGYLDRHPDFVNYDPNIQSKIDRYIEQVQSLVVKKPQYDRMDQEAYQEFHDQWYEYMGRINDGFNKTDAMLKQMPKLTESLQEQKQKLIETQKELEERRKDFSNLTKEQKKELILEQETLNKQLKDLQEKQKQANKKASDAVKKDKKQLAADTKKINAQMKNTNVAFLDGYDIVMRSEYAKMKNEANQKLKNVYHLFKDYLEDIAKQKNAHDKAQRDILKRREEIGDILEAVSNLPAKEHWYSSATTEPQVFTDVRVAVKDYLDNRDDQEKAKKAYDECRNYMQTYMKADKSGMKSGSKNENTRHQSVVRMLELMDQLPEFATFTEKEAPKEKNVSGWENLEKDDVVKDTHTKLNFQELEHSLAKHSTSKKAKSQDPEKQKKAFSDLNRRIEKTKEKKAKAQQQNQPKKQGGNQRAK